MPLVVGALNLGLGTRAGCLWWTSHLISLRGRAGRQGRLHSILGEQGSSTWQTAPQETPLRSDGPFGRARPVAGIQEAQHDVAFADGAALPIHFDAGAVRASVSRGTVLRSTSSSGSIRAHPAAEVFGGYA